MHDFHQELFDFYKITFRFGVMNSKFLLFLSFTFLLASCSGLKKQSHSGSFGGGFPDKTYPKATTQVAVAEEKTQISETREFESPNLKNEATEYSHIAQLKKKSPKPRLLIPQRPYQTYKDSAIKAPGNGSVPIETNSLLGFIFALSGLLFFPMVIPGLIFGIIGLGKYKKNPELYNVTSKGMAKAAIIISAILLFLIILYIAFIVALVLAGW
jgi:hypothetical protein